MNKKTAVVVCAIDGLVSLQTGVGVVVANFVRRFSDVKQIVKNHGYDLDLYCLTPELKSGGECHVPALESYTADTCRAMGGELMKIESLATGSSWREFYAVPPGSSPFPQWEAASRSAAFSIDVLSARYDKVLVFAHDGTFASIISYIGEPEAVRFVWVPHGLSAQMVSGPLAERRQYEDRCIQAISMSGQKIAYVGFTFREMLTDQYGVADDVLVPMINRLDIEDPRYQNSIKSYANSFDDLSDKKLIFFFGRCHKQKGIDILINALVKFFKKGRNNNYHAFVLLPLTSSNDGFWESLQNNISQISTKITIFTDFSFDIPFYFMNKKNTDIIVIPSRYEAMPIAAMEVCAFALPHIKILISDIPVFHEVFQGTREFFLIDELTPDGVYQALCSAADADARSTAKPLLPSYSIGCAEEIVGMLQ